MLKFFKRKQELEEIRLKYEELQYFLTRITKVNKRQDLYKMELEISSNRRLNYGTKKKLLKITKIKDEYLKKPWN